MPEDRREQGLVLSHSIRDNLLLARPEAADDDLVRGTEDVENLVELVDVVLALQERLTSQKFGKNTSNRPDVD